MSRNIVSRAGVGTTSRIIQHTELTFHRVVVEHDMLVMVRHGSKTVRFNDKECTVQSGEAVAIACGRTVDMTNHLGIDGHYEALVLTWDRGLVISHAKQRAMGLHPIVDLWPLRDLEPGFCAEVDTAIASLSNSTLPLHVAQHRLKAVLVWMQLHGAWFQSSEDHRFAGLVRAVLSAELELPWTAPLVAKRLGMSEATLRRRLAQEAITLSELIVDVRMSSALTMLHSTDQSIAQISNSVGYESPSRFAARFRARFGFVPTSIRRHKRNAAEL